MTMEPSWKNSIWRKGLLIVILSWIVLAIIFGIYDLQISMSIVDQTNPFGIFGADYGEQPGYTIIGIALAVLIGSAFSDIKQQKIVPLILSGLLLSLFAVGFIIDSESLIEYGGFIGFPVLFFTLVTFNKDWRPYRTIAIIIIFLALINPVLFVSITKPLCGRIRYRDLLTLGFENYTPWYLPPGPSLEHASFPSGHTAMGWMLLPLLIPLRDKQLAIKVIGNVLIIGWGVFVALSRVLIGAHFASDVLFSTGVAFVAMILLYKKYYLK
ncbi:MAG: phosphatase PAP2 family protein [Candidatus Helarchaeota archaeon]